VLFVTARNTLTGSADPPMAKPGRLVYHLAMQKFFASEAVAAAAASAAGIEEDLPAMAAQAYALADRHCSHCRNFHALWPYRRLARMCSAAESGAPVIERTLRTLLSPGGRRVLIAAAADTGLLATVARAGAGLAPDITVVDRCETPLELNRQFAARWSLPLQTRRLDLADLDLQGFDPQRFDVIYANEILQHFAKDQRLDLLARMRRALRPGGHLVCVFHTGSRIEGDVVSQYRAGYAAWLLTELERSGVPLPDSPDRFQERANDCASGLETREGAFGEPETVDALMNEAGFRIQDRVPFAVPLSETYQSFFAKLGKRRFVTVAQSPR
jgi:SAM-dependent methyltransferase